MIQYRTMKELDPVFRNFSEIREYTCQTQQGPLTYLQHGNAHVVFSPLNEHLISLSPTQAAYMATLAIAPRRIFSASRLDEFASREPGYAIEPRENAENRVKRHISALRAKLGETKEKPIIFCIPDQGYTLTPPASLIYARTTVRK